MDNNSFKKQQNFDNVESNKANNPAFQSESYHQQAKDYIRDMRSKNQEATIEGFFSSAKNNHTEEDWASHEKHYDEAWQSSDNHLPDIDG